MDGGIKSIAIDKIVGSLDKCHDLDYKFRYKRHDNLKEKFRRHQIEKATERHAFFPPIKVFRYLNEYYVVDGHRRVASAIEKNIEFIDAFITEYIPGERQDLLDGAMLRRRFESETGLKNVVLEHERGYEQLLREVEEYPSDEPYQEKAQQWKSHWLLPGCSAIAASHLTHKYPDLSSGDIYVLISGFYHDHMNGYPKNVSYETLISGFTFGRRIKKRRLFRFFIFRLLYLLFGGKRYLSVSR